MKLVDEEILKQNPWYVDSQLETLKIPAYFYTFTNRWQYISDTISTFRQNTSKKELKVLDAGCGDGLNLIQLSKEKSINLNALDYNEIRVNRVKKEFPNVNVFQSDLTKPESNLLKQFDIILCSQVIEHIPDYKSCIDTLLSYLNEDGILILGTPNEGCLLAKIRNNLLEKSILKNTDHIHFFKINQFIPYIRGKKLRIENVYTENFFYPKTKWFLKMGESGFKRKISQFLMNLFPSQVAGFYLTIKK